MAKAVRRDEHKMHAFVRFREVGREREARFVAWFEPEHHIVELAAPFFARRFADMPWSILTPDLCAHWDGLAVSFTPGVAKSEAPTEDRLEELWRRYYASIFNPARLKVKAMQTEMPKKYWRNLPEASLIRPSDRGRRAHHRRHDRPRGHRTAQGAETAGARDETQIQPRQRHRDTARGSRLLPRLPALEGRDPDRVRRRPGACRIMLVGEQPGDKEDLAGHPFVGPAGQMLDRALEEAGIDRDKVYVTNAVKHFKFVPRGKIRLHQKPATPEIKACRPWYERELAAVKPGLVVALGATAAQCVFGKITPINKNRGRLIDLDEGVQALVTVHPSYLLRLPDEDGQSAGIPALRRRPENRCRNLCENRHAPPEVFPQHVQRFPAMRRKHVCGRAISPACHMHRSKSGPLGTRRNSNERHGVTRFNRACPHQGA